MMSFSVLRYYEFKFLSAIINSSSENDDNYNNKKSSSNNNNKNNNNAYNNVITMITEAAVSRTRTTKWLFITYVLAKQPSVQLL